MKSNQKGFSVFEMLVVIVIVGLIVTVGWLVLDRQKLAGQTNNAKTNTSNQTSSRPQSTAPYANADSTNCQWINTEAKAALLGEWQERISNTQEIQTLQREENSSVMYQTSPGTLCDLNDGYKVVSFGHIKNVTQSDGTIDETYTKGIFVYTPGNTEELSVINVKCEKRPPDATAPIEVSSVEKGIVHLTCPGYEPAQKFDVDLRTKSLTKVQ